jgi:pimeloyl-ACP methyl ester carboxylesterase
MIDKARRASLSSARRVVRRILLAPFAIVAVAILAFCVIKTWRLLDWRNVGQAGIAEVVAVPIRGAVQYVFIRGYDRRKPVLLFLPGGPGESYVPREAEFSRGLEHDFVMAQVEFGVGKAEIYKASPDIQQFAMDGEAIVDVLRNEFGGKPIFLVGHSLGSVQALLIAQHSPQKIAALATIGQVVDWRRGNELAAAQIRSRAAARGDQSALAQLDTFPHTLTAAENPLMIDFGSAVKQRALERQYGMDSITGRHTPETHWFLYVTAPNHSLRQSCNLAYQVPMCQTIAGSKDWFGEWHNLIPGIVGFDAERDVPELKVPFLAIVGTNDWVSPAVLVKEYEEKLIAPKKQFVAIENAGHYTHFDSPAEFQRAIKEAWVRTSPAAQNIR